MSIQTALENIHLQSLSRWVYTGYNLEYHKSYLAKRAGVYSNSPSLMRKACDQLVTDFLWCTDWFNFSA